MIKRTFADVKAELSRVAGVSGMPVNDARLRTIVDIAQERLCGEGEWPFQYARVKFNQYGGILALPAEFEALVHTTIDRSSAEVYPQWFEMLDYGPGPTDKEHWRNVVIDYGEAPVFRQPGADGATLRVTSTDGADTSTVRVEGFDTEGVRRVETFTLPDATSATKWSKITAVAKSVTAGDVVVSYTDQFGDQYVAATYRYRDTNPSFRTYRVPIDEDKSGLIHGIVRRRLYPVRSDNDELFVTNIAALRLAVKAVALEDADKFAESETAFAIARRILGQEAKHYRAGQTVPVRVTRINNLSERPDLY